MKTAMEKMGFYSGKSSQSVRGNKERLKRILREMLSDGTAWKFCAQQRPRPVCRRIIE